MIVIEFSDSLFSALSIAFSFAFGIDELTVLLLLVKGFATSAAKLLVNVFLRSID